MAEMDLIPGEFRQRLRRRALMRQLGLACVLLLVGIGVGRALLGYLTWREKTQVASLERKQSVAEQSKVKAQDYQQRKQVVEKQILALDELRGRGRVGQFLHAMDAAYDEGIWLDNLHFLRRSGTGTLSNTPGAANAGIIVVPTSPPTSAQTLELAQGVDIVGHALNHSRLADFMRKLGMQPGVADLRLIDTRLRAYTSAQVVDFSISLQLDKKAAAQP